MTQEKVDRIKNGFDNLMESDITRTVLIVGGVLVALYLSTYVLAIVTSVVIAVKQLSAAIKKQV
jgi:hypothetical protein